MAAQLRRDHSPRKLAEAVTLYHVVVEGTLAQPGQHIIEASLEALDLMPGFRAGIRNVALDEQRHTLQRGATARDRPAAGRDRALPVPMEVDPRERARHGLALLRAGLLGQRNGPIGRDPETVRILFDLLARNARGEEVPHGTSIQWDFRDFEPWYLQLDGVVKTAVQGRLAKPTVRMRMGFDDFAELISRRSPPAALVARGRMRPWATRACC